MLIEFLIKIEAYYFCKLFLNIFAIVFKNIKATVLFLLFGFFFDYVYHVLNKIFVTVKSIFKWVMFKYEKKCSDC